jgi:hypothetical protein
MKLKLHFIIFLTNGSWYEKLSHDIKYKTHVLQRLFETFFNAVIFIEVPKEKNSVCILVQLILQQQICIRSQ